MPYSEMQRKDEADTAYTILFLSECMLNLVAASSYILVGIQSNGRPFVNVNLSGILIPVILHTIHVDTQQIT